MALDDQVLEIFVLSCLEQLKDIESALLALEEAGNGPGSNEKIAAVFRAAHSIKGDAHSMGLAHISRLAHGIENILQAVKDGRLPISGKLVTVLLQGFDRLKETIIRCREAPPEELSEELARLDAFARFACLPPDIEADVARPPAPAEHEPVPSPTERGAQTSPDGPGGSIERIGSINVPAQQLDNLLNLMGEFIMVQAKLSELASGAGNEQLLSAVGDIERFGEELRMQVLNLRMLPLQVCFSKFRRLARDLSVKLGKEVELVLSGGETRLDKAVIEQIDPVLVHLFRNAVDHGIEPPHIRVPAGKSPQGRVRLAAEQTGNEVLITMEDDGAGIDGERLVREAVSAGVVPASQARDLPAGEVLNLIFVPGLSTAGGVSEISGRGIGMDVVKRNLNALGGSIDISSTKGRGASFRIRLPLSMAIVECLHVKLGDSSYMLQLEYVEECLEYVRSNEKIRKGRMILNVRGRALPLICVRKCFGIPGDGPDRAQVVVVGTRDEQLGIVVDDVVGRKQAVVKKLGPLFGVVEGILGVTIMENGRIAMILDIPALVRMGSREDGKRKNGRENGEIRQY